MGRIFNIPGRGSSRRVPNTPSAAPSISSPEIPDVSLSEAPQQLVRDDLVLIPFNDKVSLLLTSLGAEIAGKIHHTNGGDFLLLALPGNIYAEQARIPRAGEFVGTEVAPVATLLYSADHRLLLHSTGFRGEMTASIGESWVALADEIHKHNTGVVIPDSIIRLSGHSEHQIGLDDLVEKVASGCTKLGLYDVYSRAVTEYAAQNGLLQTPRTEREKAFADYLEPHIDAVKNIGAERLRIARSMELFPALDISVSAPSL